MKKGIRKIFAGAATLCMAMTFGCSSLFTRRAAAPEHFGFVLGYYDDGNIGYDEVRARLQELNERYPRLAREPENRLALLNYLSAFDDLKDKPVMEKLYEVDRRVDESIVYIIDRKNYGLDEYWATPMETVRKGRGDCEDLAILKHAVLRYLGVSVSDMRMIGLEEKFNPENGHAVLMVKTEMGGFILDINDRDSGPIPEIFYAVIAGHFNLNGVYRLKP